MHIWARSRDWPGLVVLTLRLQLRQCPCLLQPLGDPATCATLGAEYFHATCLLRASCLPCWLPPGLLSPSPLCMPAPPTPPP